MAFRFLLPILLVGVFFASARLGAQTPAPDAAAIEQSRIYRDAPTPQAATDENNSVGASLTSGATSDDDSFGAQKILKAQERPPTIVVSGDASFNFTDNVALTRRGERSDTFEVLDAAIAWAPSLQKNLIGSLGFHVSSFLYNKTTALDFTNLGCGAGLVWTPNNFGGISFIARYDFTELLNRHSDEILNDHAFTLALQKVIPLGRAHALIFGANGLLDIADPAVEQQHQLGLTAGYHLDLTRQMSVDVGYHPAAHFYSDAGRTDFNQIVSGNLQYRFNQWAQLNASVSHGLNRSNHSAFDYDVVNTGASVGLTIRF